jgi:putative ABC transport system permease protein
MFALLRVLLSDLRRHPVGTLLPGVALAVGLACVVSSVLVGGAYDTAIQRNSAHTPPGSAVVIMAGGSDIPASVLTEVQQLTGVAAVQPRQVTSGQLIGPDGKPRSNRVSIRVEPSDPRLATTTILAGRLPQGTGEIAIDEVNAHRDHPLGSTVALVDYRTGKPVQARIVGVTAQDLGSPGGIGMVATPAFAAAHLDSTTIYGADIVLTAGTPVYAMLPKILVTAGADYRVETAAQAREQEQPSRLGVSSTLFVLFSLLALATAVLVAGAAFRAVAASRIRRTALLRALGAARPALVVVTIAEAVLIGLVAAVLAVASGWFVSAGMLNVLNSVGVSALLGSNGVTPAVPGLLLSSIAALLGVAAAVTAALRPAIQASGVPPVAALAAVPDAPVERRAGIMRLIFGTVLLALALMLAMMGIVAKSFFPILVSAVFTMIGLFGVLGPLVVPVLVRVPGWLAGLVAMRLGVVGAVIRVAAREPSRTPRRAAAVAMPLAGAFSLLAFGVVGTASLRASIAQRSDAASFDTASLLGWGLLGLSVLAAVSGVVATTAVSVTERRRELALSRALGVTRTGVGIQVVTEATLLAAVTATTGSLIGYLYGVACVSMLGLSTVVVPPLPLLLSLAAVSLLAILAAAGPAIRGALLTPTSALADS